jgi:hypothetical protein
LPSKLFRVSSSRLPAKLFPAFAQYRLQGCDLFRCRAAG